MARENRAFLGRAVRYLAAEAGIRQFLDIGTGLPATSNVHEVAQGIAPSSRILCADNDPMVLAHGRALLTSAPEGRTAYIRGDLRDPEAILSDPVTREVLDFTQPIALMLVAILHFIPDDDKPGELVTSLLDALPPGSYLAASHSTAEHSATADDGVRAYQDAGIPMSLRDSADFARLAFTGLELIPPGVVLVSDWRPEEARPRPVPGEVNTYGGVARKPLRSGGGVRQGQPRTPAPASRPASTAKTELQPAEDTGSSASSSRPRPGRPRPCRTAIRQQGMRPVPGAPSYPYLPTPPRTGTGVGAKGLGPGRHS
jgi:hypothetical protein